MQLQELKNFFNQPHTLPAIHKPHPAMTCHDVPLFIKQCFQEIEYDMQLQRIKDIRMEWLIKLKHEIENPKEQINPENLYVIKTHPDIKDCFKLPHEEYEALRNKIQNKLLEYYEKVRANDAGLNGYSIHFYCQIGQHGAMQGFNVEEWISNERSGNFDTAYKVVMRHIEHQSGWAKRLYLKKD